MENQKAHAKFKFKVNNSHYETEIECPTGRQIFEIAGIEDPDAYDLIVIKEGKDELVKLDQTICLSDPGVERFRARPRKVNDGEKGGESPLPLKDLTFLNNSFADKWKLVEEGNYKLLHICEFALPSGYNVQKTDITIIIPAMYDSVQLDMVYFKMPLSREDNTPIRSLTNINFGQDVYQQWSRHRDNDNPWIIGLDCIETHIDYIRLFLRKELER